MGSFFEKTLYFRMSFFFAFLIHFMRFKVLWVHQTKIYKKIWHMKIMHHFYKKNMLFYFDMFYVFYVLFLCF
jgi:hypothetical protein